MQRYSWPAKLLIGFVSVSGFGVLCYALLTQHVVPDLRLLSFAVVAVIASRLKVTLPELNSSMSVNLPLLLLATAWLSLPAALIVGTLSALTQSIAPKGYSFRPVQALFNFSISTMAVGAGWTVLNRDFILRATELPEKMLLLIVASGMFFAFQTVPVAAILSLTQSVRGLQVWLDIFTYSFPYYVLSACLSSVMSIAQRSIGGYLPVVTLLVMYGVYRSHRWYFRDSTVKAPALAKARTAGAM